MIGDSLTAPGRGWRELYHGIGGKHTIEIDGARETHAANDVGRLIWRTRLRNYRGAWCNAAVLRLRRLRCISFLVGRTPTENYSQH
jgi:hypothetical protein